MRTIFRLRDDVSIDKAADALADWLYKFSDDYDLSFDKPKEVLYDAYEFLEQENLHRCFK